VERAATPVSSSAMGLVSMLAAMAMPAAMAMSTL
jgi:hypothetical protein